MKVQVSRVIDMWRHNQFDNNIMVMVCTNIAMTISLLTLLICMSVDLLSYPCDANASATQYVGAYV